MFIRGEDSILRFGQTTVAELTRLLDDPDAEIRSYEDAPLKTLVICGDVSFGFYGDNAVFAALEVSAHYSTAQFPDGRPIDYGMHRPWPGRVKMNLGPHEWKQIETLSGFVNLQVFDDCELGANKEKQLSLTYRAGARVLRLMFQLEPHQRDLGIYEFDYFLNALVIRDESIAPKT